MHFRQLFLTFWGSSFIPARGNETGAKVIGGKNENENRGESPGLYPAEPLG